MESTPNKIFTVKLKMGLDSVDLFFYDDGTYNINREYYKGIRCNWKWDIEQQTIMVCYMIRNGDQIWTSCDKEITSSYINYVKRLLIVS